MTVNFETTDNPHTYRFVFDGEITDKSAHMKTAEEAVISPLASKLFGFPWAEEIEIGKNFVNVTKQDWVDWDIIAEPLTHILSEHVEKKLPIFATASTAKPLVNSNEYQVFFEATPNPQSMKFYATQAFANGSLQMTSSEEAGRSPLAQKIFNFPWVEAVFVGPQFVTVTKKDFVEWSTIAEPLCEMIEDALNKGVIALVAEDSLKVLEDDNAEVALIKKILNEEIRPAVARDGGDIVFERFEDGFVHIHMQGACSNCPSSTITLKQGIETRLKDAVPSIKEVVSI